LFPLKQIIDSFPLRYVFMVNAIYWVVFIKLLTSLTVNICLTDSIFSKAYHRPLQQLQLNTHTHCTLRTYLSVLFFFLFLFLITCLTLLTAGLTATAGTTLAFGGHLRQRNKGWRSNRTRPTTVSGHHAGKIRVVRMSHLVSKNSNAKIWGFQKVIGGNYRILGCDAVIGGHLRQRNKGWRSNRTRPTTASEHHDGKIRVVRMSHLASKNLRFSKGHRGKLPDSGMWRRHLACV